ncbi:hypothetical protein [Catenuloplanes atrovinosus]|uniref:Uncharacterized protein n=1 Tax=Catenuloplanes atrovinosus TaxID=137266 RepID=A0AAE4CA51_9ACTN|nr:hypothetical protein [Catenuloplanes atrovinosus]MDR7274275.1 hypothetical protein [Catenuloplanes atrovinosus]
MTDAEYEYRYQMVYEQGRKRVMSDDPAELLDHLIPGYLDLPEELHPALRLSHAEESVHRLQQRINVAFGLDESDPERWRLLTTERTRPPAIEAWSGPVPLVLVAAHYAPHTELPRPREEDGRIVWLDTEDDDSYLRSVALAGDIFLAMRVTDEPEPVDEPEEPETPENPETPEPAQVTPPPPPPPNLPQWSMPFSTASSGPAGDVPLN